MERLNIPTPLYPRPGLLRNGLQSQSYKHFFIIANIFTISMNFNKNTENAEIISFPKVRYQRSQINLCESYGDKYAYWGFSFFNIVE